MTEDAAAVAPPADSVDVEKRRRGWRIPVAVLAVVLAICLALPAAVLNTVAGAAAPALVRCAGVKGSSITMSGYPILPGILTGALPKLRFSAARLQSAKYTVSDVSATVSGGRVGLFNMVRGHGPVTAGSVRATALLAPGDLSRTFTSEIGLPVIAHPHDGYLDITVTISGKRLGPFPVRLKANGATLLVQADSAAAGPLSKLTITMPAGVVLEKATVTTGGLAVLASVTPGTDLTGIVCEPISISPSLAGLHP